MAILGSSRILVSPNPGTTIIAGDVTALSGGRFAVVYRDGSNQQARSRIFEADGTPVTGPIAASLSNGADPVIAGLANGGFVVAYFTITATGGDTSGSSLYAQTFDASGVAVGSRFLVNTTTANDQTEPAIAVLANGHFVVSWSDDGTVADAYNTAIRARVFNQDGSPFSAEFRVDVGTPFSIDLSAITALPDGRFIVSYSRSLPSATNDLDVMARIFNPDGSQSVAEFRINTTTDQRQDNVKLATLADGNFVAIYESKDGPVIGGGVFAKIFNTNGTQSVAEFRVNGETLGRQWKSDVAGLADGRFVVVFTNSPEGTAPTTVRAIVFNADGSVSVPEFVVETMDFFAAVPKVAAMPDGRFVVSISDIGNPSDNGVSAYVFDPKVNIGTANAENLTGAALNDTLYGYEGNDSLYGRGGNDVLFGGLGADYLDGGEGFDVASYAQATSGVDVRLYEGKGLTGEATADVLLNIEGLIGSAYADVLIGNVGNNYFVGDAGDDYFDGFGGTDSFYGQTGNDWVNMRSGIEYVDGGDGLDMVSYFYASTGVTVRFDNSALNTGDAAGDTYISVERVFGSAFGDVLVGANGQGDLLYGNSGNDYLYGGGANDFLYGGTGDDFLTGGAGDDVIDGGTDVDILSYIDATAGVALTLSESGSGSFVVGGFGTDTYTSIEGLSGSYTAGDSLTGNAAANILYGYGGNDILNGGAGSDTLSGGDGDDFVYYDSADLAANVTGGEGTDTLYFVLPGGSTPTSINLAAQGFERGVVDQADVNSNQPWSLFRFNYDQEWRLDYRDIYFDTGARWTQSMDELSNQAWTELRDVYTTTNLYDYQDIYFDTGARWLRNFDELSNQTWAEQRDVYTTTGLYDYQDVYFDDGSRWLRNFDELNNQIYAEQRDVYTTTGLYDYQDIYLKASYASNPGGRIIRDFDQAGAFSWNEHRVTYNSAGQIIEDVYL
jgi:Ca2+-binding RTX toxin-like protein